MQAAEEMARESARWRTAPWFHYTVHSQIKRFLAHICATVCTCCVNKLKELSWIYTCLQWRRQGRAEGG